MPSSIAIATASARFVAPSLRYTRDRCQFTVRSPIPRFAAISFEVSPRATWRRISTSRLDSGTRASSLAPPPIARHLARPAEIRGWQNRKRARKVVSAASIGLGPRWEIRTGKTGEQIDDSPQIDRSGSRGDDPRRERLRVALFGTRARRDAHHFQWTGDRDQRTGRRHRDRPDRRYGSGESIGRRAGRDAGGVSDLGRA